MQIAGLFPINEVIHKSVPVMAAVIN